MNRVLVIGGGASGMMAAICAAMKGCHVTVYEKKDRVGKKILVTGNGKCNLTNMHLDTDCYYTTSKEQLEKYIRQFDHEDTILFFKECGLLLKEKNGYVYPACEQASTVLDILRNKLKQHHVRIKTEIQILSIDKEHNGLWNVKSNQGIEQFDKIIMACGSYAGVKDYKTVDGYHLANKLGHTIHKVYPALVQLSCDETFFHAIAGVRIDAIMTLLDGKEVLAKERGELQITDYGVSGIPIFQFSRMIPQLLKAKRQIKLSIDFLPEYAEDEWRLFIKNRVLSYQGEMIEEFFTGLLHKKLNALFMKLFSLKPQETICEENWERIEDACMHMKRFIVTPNGTKSYENAQTCSGGIPFDELDENLQSKICKDLYFCGEMIDVDGRCGGYNLQWAWTSGYITGNHSAKE